MTGFARAEGVEGALRWAWEVKSVNARNLDIRARLPAGFDALDPVVRRVVPLRCRRGSVSVTLTTSLEAQARVRINRAVLEQLLELRRELGPLVEEAKPRFESLLGIRGVVELVEEPEPSEARDSRLGMLTGALERTLDALQAMRLEEGARLAVLARSLLDEVERLTEAARRAAAAQPEAVRARLAAQLGVLLETTPGLPEERLAQEAALLAARADVREELDRLSAHVAAARSMLDEGGPIGRKLDFLCQELNREVNTLCAKSADVELTRLGLDLKAAVEQLREQVQNIE
ncbi:MAG: YicC family protein [Rhodospirillaceae bacterium]|nr:YicC family protein [Rhodospirillaceae bacterium]